MDSPSTRLLQTYADVRFGQRVLTLGVAPELAADWTVRASGGGQVWAIADDLADVQATERLAREEHLSGLHALHAADLAALPAPAFDGCAVDIAGYPQRGYLHHMLWEAVQHLKPEGALWIAGPNDGGIQSLEKRLRDAWGEVSVLGYKKGHRVLYVPCPAAPAPLEEAAPASKRLALRGEKFTLVQRAGVFAGGDLDPATRMLANELEVGDSATILDLGCGSGILGMLAARLANDCQVTLVDNSAVALATAQENCHLNTLSNTQILASDGVTAMRDQRFDLVLCNPPFHEHRAHSNATGLRFIREVSGILAPRGRFYLVANQFLRYEPAMREAFDSVTTLVQDRKYKVLLAESHG